MPEVTFDRGPVMVTGAVRGYRSRVVITEGVMYIAHSATKVDRLVLTGELVEDAARAGSTWKAWKVETENGTAYLTTRGCPSCGYRLGRLKLSEILRVGDDSR